ncbi:hypothetical protein AVEN_212542-1 [Araneus ventricosus]|uniref:Uncharacterized protein n=1 Tax=Araneus ventricosus TaxID=182803 RepID=A0A4Y2JRY3_ARAVE|nr:hypothetical protein AVEN_212542-1 [Araneus ventricosus]
MPADPDSNQHQQTGKSPVTSKEADHRIRDRSPTCLQISDEFAENAIAINKAITLKHSLAEWSRTMRTYPKYDPGFQKVLAEAQKLSHPINSFLTTLGIPLFRLPESTSHLAQITERAKSQRKSEAKRINPAKSHPKIKINLESNKLNSTPKTSPKEKVK